MNFIARRVWQEYYFCVDAIVFLIDVANEKRFLEAKTELDNILKEEQIANLPILILGNKIDKFGAKSEHEILQLFGLTGLMTGKVSAYDRLRIFSFQMHIYFKLHTFYREKYQKKN